MASRRNGFRNGDNIVRDMQRQLSAKRSQMEESQGSLTTLGEGTYTIETAYANHVPDSRSDRGLSAGPRNGPASLGYTGNLRRKMGIALRNDKSGELACLMLDADRYSLDIMHDLIGKKVISTTGGISVEGGRCNIVAPGELDSQNMISPANLIVAEARKSLFDFLGLGRWEMLEPDTVYEIQGTSDSIQVDTLRHHTLRMLEVAVERSIQGDSASISEGAGGTQESRSMKVRMYFAVHEMPEFDRAKIFFTKRIGHCFMPKRHVPTIVQPSRVNEFLSEFVTLNETPMIRRDEVYVIDSIDEGDARCSYLFYHRVDAHGRLVNDDKNMPVMKSLVFVLTGYPAPAEGTDTQLYLRLSQTNRIHTYFDRIKLAQDANRGWVFTAAEDVYDGMLDFMRTPTGPAPTNLFEFAFIDFDDRAAIDNLRSRSLERRLLRKKNLRDWTPLDPPRD